MPRLVLAWERVSELAWVQVSGTWIGCTIVGQQCNGNCHLCGQHRNENWRLKTIITNERTYRL